jgi:hypothetical protein
VPNNRKLGFLVQNSGNVTAALGGANTADIGLTVEISSDGGLHFETVVAAAVTPLKLTRNTAGASAASAPANETPLTVENCRAAIYQALRYGFPLENELTGEKRIIFLNDLGQIEGRPVPTVP